MLLCFSFPQPCGGSSVNNENDTFSISFHEGHSSFRIDYLINRYCILDNDWLLLKWKNVITRSTLRVAAI